MIRETEAASSACRRGGRRRFPPPRGPRPAARDVRRDSVASSSTRSKTPPPRSRSTTCCSPPTALLEPQGEIEVRLSGDFIFVNGTRLRLELDNYASFSHLLDHLQSGGPRRAQGPPRRRPPGLADLPRRAALGHSQGARIRRRSSSCGRSSGRAGITRIEVEPTLETEELLAEAEKAKEAAKRTYSLGVAVTKDLINSVRMGRTTSVARVKRAVQSIVDQVLNNETSLVGLTTLRDYDEYTFTHSVNVCILAVADRQEARPPAAPALRSRDGRACCTTSARRGSRSTCSTSPGASTTTSGA